jgi:hypothetical protein
MPTMPACSCAAVEKHSIAIEKHSVQAQTHSIAAEEHSVAVEKHSSCMLMHAHAEPRYRSAGTAGSCMLMQPDHACSCTQLCRDLPMTKQQHV